MLRLSNAMLISFLLIFLLVFELKDINIEPIISFASIWQLIIITAAFILSLIAGRAPINSKSFVFLGLVTVFFIWSLAVSLNSGEPQLSLQRLLLLFIATYLVFIAVLSLKDVELFISTFFKGIVFLC